MKVTLDMIKTDVNYDELCLFESHLTHELKRLGADLFIQKYKDYSIYSNDYDKMILLIAYLKYLGYSCDFSMKTDKIILDPFSFLDFKDGDLTEEELQSLYENSLDSFKSYGLLFSEIGGFADGTYY